MLPGVDGARLLTAGLGLLLFLTVIATALAHRRHRAWLGIPLLAGFATVTYIGVSKWAEFSRLEFVGFEGVPYEFHVQSALVVDVVAASIGVALSLLLLAQSLRERRARHPTVPSPSALES